jgi:uncharacterized protein YndB with AHSA1/START domain
MGTTDFRMERSTMIFRRRFAAAPAVLWRAWTDPEELKRWFGPATATNVSTQLDVRVGGHWRVVTELDGTRYPLKGVYAEVVPDERLVFSMDASEHPDAWHNHLDSLRDTPSGARAGAIVTTVTFATSDNDTVLTVSQRFDESSDRDAHYHMGSPRGWGESFDRLEQLLA